MIYQKINGNTYNFNQLYTNINNSIKQILKGYIGDSNNKAKLFYKDTFKVIKNLYPNTTVIDTVGMAASSYISGNAVQYVAGGVTDYTNPSANPTGSVYSVSSGTVSKSSSSISPARYGLSSGILTTSSSTYSFFVGGYINGTTASNHHSRVSSTGTITNSTSTSGHVSCAYPGVEPINDKLIIAGGETTQSNRINTISYVSGTSHSWTTNSNSLSINKSYIGTASISNKIIMAGGKISSNTYTNNVDIIDSNLTVNTISNASLSYPSYYTQSSKQCSKIGDEGWFARHDNAATGDTTIDIYNSSLVKTILNIGNRGSVSALDDYCWGSSNPIHGAIIIIKNKAYYIDHNKTFHLGSECIVNDNSNYIPGITFEYGSSGGVFCANGIVNGNTNIKNTAFLLKVTE